MPEDRLDLPARRVPEADRPVVACGGESPTIGGVGELPDRALVPGELGHRAAYRDVPSDDLRLVIARGESTTVGRKPHAMEGDPWGVPVPAEPQPLAGG